MQEVVMEGNNKLEYSLSDVQEIVFITLSSVSNILCDKARDKGFNISLRAEDYDQWRENVVKSLIEAGRKRKSRAKREIHKRVVDFVFSYNVLPTDSAPLVHLAFLQHDSLTDEQLPFDVFFKTYKNVMLKYATMLSNHSPENRVVVRSNKNKSAECVKVYKDGLRADLLSVIDSFDAKIDGGTRDDGVLVSKRDFYERFIDISGRDSSKLAKQSLGRFMSCDVGIASIRYKDDCFWVFGKKSQLDG